MGNNKLNRSYTECKLSNKFFSHVKLNKVYLRMSLVCAMLRPTKIQITVLYLIGEQPNDMHE